MNEKPWNFSLLNISRRRNSPTSPPAAFQSTNCIKQISFARLIKIQCFFFRQFLRPRKINPPNAENSYLIDIQISFVSFITFSAQHFGPWLSLDTRQNNQPKRRRRSASALLGGTREVLWWKEHLPNGKASAAFIHPTNNNIQNTLLLQQSKKNSKKYFHEKKKVFLTENNQTRHAKLFFSLLLQHTIKVPLFDLNIIFFAIFLFRGKKRDPRKWFDSLGAPARVCVAARRTRVCELFSRLCHGEYISLVYAFNYVLINFERFLCCFHSSFFLSLTFFLAALQQYGKRNKREQSRLRGKTVQLITAGANNIFFLSLSANS